MIATKVFFLIFVIFLIAIEPTSGWRTFWKGRKFDGNVGHPTEFHGSLKSPADEDLWFVQKLDHFDPTNQQTWRQVCQELLNNFPIYIFSWLHLK